jgi:hypothetical protein
VLSDPYSIFEIYPDAARVNPYILPDAVLRNDDQIVEIARDFLSDAEQSAVLQLALVPETAPRTPSTYTSERMVIIKHLVELGVTLNDVDPLDCSPYMLYYREVSERYRLKVAKAATPHLGTDIADLVASFF